MATCAQTDLTFLAARVHGRRSRVAEGPVLDTLCALPTVAELSRRVLGGAEIASAPELQRAMIRRLVLELLELRDHTRDPIRALLDWELVRFAASNLKVLLRGVLNRVPPEELIVHLVELPEQDPALGKVLASSKDVRSFISRLPRQSLREPLERALRVRVDQTHPLLLEAALDQAWLQGMMSRALALGGQDAGLVREVVAQEARIFHLVLALRGRAQQGIAPGELRRWQVELSPTESRRFASMTAASDSRAVLVAAAVAATDASSAESFAWSRFLCLANRAFRRSPMGEAAIAGYTFIRRIELSNLITVSEGIRNGVPAAQLRSRLVPRTPEATHA